MESTKKAWGFCPKCRTKVHIDQPDHGARIKAVELWLEQGFGRPGSGAALVSPEVAAADIGLSELEAMSTPALAAFAFGAMSEEERAAQRQLVEDLEAEDWPPRFAEALYRLNELVKQPAGA